VAEEAAEALVAAVMRAVAVASELPLALAGKSQWAAAPRCREAPDT